MVAKLLESSKRVAIWEQRTGMKKIFKKIIIGVLTLLFLLGISMHFRAYMYSEAELRVRVENALHTEISKRTSCDELQFIKRAKPNSYREVVVYEWVCFNKSIDGYLITATVESDNYIDIARIALSEDEIRNIIKLNNKN